MMMITQFLVNLKSEAMRYWCVTAIPEQNEILIFLVE